MAAVIVWKFDLPIVAPFELLEIVFHELLPKFEVSDEYTEITSLFHLVDEHLGELIDVTTVTIVGHLETMQEDELFVPEIGHQITKDSLRVLRLL